MRQKFAAEKNAVPFLTAAAILLLQKVSFSPTFVSFAVELCKFISVQRWPQVSYGRNISHPAYVVYSWHFYSMNAVMIVTVR